MIACPYFRAIFNWVSKVIRDCIGFALLRFNTVIGLENSRHPLNQSDAKVKPIATWSLAFSRAWGRFPLKFSFVLIGRCDYFGFGFTTLNRKALYTCKNWVNCGLLLATELRSWPWYWGWVFKRQAAHIQQKLNQVTLSPAGLTSDSN